MVLPAFSRNGPSALRSKFPLAQILILEIGMSHELNTILPIIQDMVLTLQFDHY